MEYSKNTVADYLTKFMMALKKQLDEDEKRWGDTWKKRPVEGQEERTRSTFNNYFDMFENGKTPIPWLKVAGNALICWIREYERDNYYENVAKDLHNEGLKILDKLADIDYPNNREYLTFDLNEVTSGSQGDGISPNVSIE